MRPIAELYIYCDDPRHLGGREVGVARYEKRPPAYKSLPIGPLGRGLATHDHFWADADPIMSGRGASRTGLTRYADGTEAVGWRRKMEPEDHRQAVELPPIIAPDDELSRRLFPSREREVLRLECRKCRKRTRGIRGRGKKHVVIDMRREYLDAALELAINGAEGHVEMSIREFAPIYAKAASMESAGRKRDPAG